jgi:hypothetical protein
LKVLTKATEIKTLVSGTAFPELNTKEQIFELKFKDDKNFVANI